MRNNGIKLEIEKIAEENTESLIIAGDFNGHVGFKGKQKLDKNGEIILHWMDRFGMVMLNDEECKGEVTWRQGEHCSVIDYVLVNDKAYKRFTNMEIDDKKEVYDLSDHNLIEAVFKVKEGIKDFKKDWIVREYYKTDQEALSKFREVRKEDKRGR